MTNKNLFMIIAMIITMILALSIGFALGTYTTKDNLSKEKEISVYELLLKARE